MIKVVSQKYYKNLFLKIVQSCASSSQTIAHICSDLNQCLYLLLFRVSNQIHVLEQQLKTINFTQIFFVPTLYILAAFSHKIFAWAGIKTLFIFTLQKQLAARRAKHDFWIVRNRQSLLPLQGSLHIQNLENFPYTLTIYMCTKIHGLGLNIFRSF